MNGVTIRYIIHPYNVESVNDGCNHYISGSQLINLYGLNPMECKIVTTREDFRGDHKEYFHLYPRRKGDYAEFIALIKKQELSKQKER